MGFLIALFIVLFAIWVLLGLARGIPIIMLLVVFAILMLIALARGVRVVRQDQYGLIQRLGRYDRSVGPGTVMLVPFIDDLVLVDMRERRVEMHNKPARAAGGKPLEFDAELRYQVIDAVKAQYEVRDIDMACALRAEEFLRKELEREPTLFTSGAQGALASRAQARLAEDAASWGTTIAALSLLRVRPLAANPAGTTGSSGETERSGRGA